MKKMKKYLYILISTITIIFFLAGCSTNQNNTTNAESNNETVLRLGHNMNEAHTVHEALVSFSEKVNSRTDGRIQIEIYPNGQLGTETEMLEQMQAGILDITKVGSPQMANHYDAYHTFGLPYLFDNQEQFYKVMDSDAMQDFFLESGEEYGFSTLTYYTSGQRSFYTPNTPIQEPEDLNGMNIRVQNLSSQTDMISALGGSPVGMGYGEVYTALQTGIIDGTENNETALTEGQHGEVAKVYSYTEHAIIPDVLVISQETREKLSNQDFQIIVEAARESTEEHKELWEDAVTESKKTAKEEMDVTFINDINKEPFKEATEHIIEEYSNEYEGVGRLVNLIESIK